MKNKNGLIQKIKSKMPFKVRKGLKIGVGIFTGIIMLLVLYMLVCNIIAVREEKPVQYFGYSYSYVPTESMEPTIKAGDSIFFKKTSYSKCEVGDIIIYKSTEGKTKGLYIVHRIVEITDQGFIVKGDNNDSIDSEYVTSDKLIGKYVKTFNFLNIGKLASNKNLIYSILIVFFIIIMVSEGVNIYLIKNKKKLKDSNKVSNDELKEQLLMEMKEELLKEIEEEEKNTKEDSN